MALVMSVIALVAPYRNKCLIHYILELGNIGIYDPEVPFMIKMSSVMEIFPKIS